MPAYYRASLSEFVVEPASSIIGELTLANGQARFPLSPEAIEAWNAQLPPLREACRHLVSCRPGSGGWEILLEYPIPQVGKRIDAVILAGNLIIVIETKTGEAATSAAQQVEDYALNLACFHEASHNNTIVPVVVSNAPTKRSNAVLPFMSSIAPCRFSTMAGLGVLLDTICQENRQSTQPQINPDQPPPEIVPPDETPTWWEIECGYKLPLPGQVTNPPQRTQSDTEEQQKENDSGEMKVPFLSQRVEDIRGMADPAFKTEAQRHGAETTLSR